MLVSSLRFKDLLNFLHQIRVGHRRSTEPDRIDDPELI